jgi:predicted ATPase/class 3 adenylate cyclase
MSEVAGQALPSGTLTFLFTDIEGSTGLAQELGPEGYGDVLVQHRELLRAAWAAHGGTEVGTEGDSFFVVFAAAPAAVAAAVDAQRALAAAHFPHGVATVRVRMGLHTGLGVLSGGTYVGADVNRAARIAAAANGGQVVLSSSTVPLLGEGLPAGVRARDLGEHRLKDLRPERLALLEIDGLAVDPRPIRSLDNRPNNLPTQVTSFVGRAAELEETSAMLDTSRLLTLTGPGGTGKTRLSLQLAASVAEGFPDGVYFVALEPIREPALVGPTIAGVLGLAEDGAVPIVERLAGWIADRKILLVLDNFEQVVDAAPLVGELVRATSELKLIVSSRAALHVSGEQEYPVPGLPTPPDPSSLGAYGRAQLPDDLRVPDPATLDRYESVRLFVARATAVRPAFRLTIENAAAVAGIAARLQGMPLAIELAAARVKLLPPESILERLQDQLAMLAGGARDLPERQQTLRGAIAWSYELLDDPGRRLIGRLSVFTAGCSLEMAEAICGPAAELGSDVLDGIGALVDQSLVRAEEVAGEPRFRMLETIRAFSAEQLVAGGDADTIRERHARAFLALAEEAAGKLSGEAQRSWLDRLDIEHDNLRSALEWATARPDPALAIRLGFALWRFWQKRGYLVEGRRRLERIAAEPWSRDDPALRARLMEALGGIAWWQADLEAMASFYAEALDSWRSTGDQAEIANALYNASFSYVFADGPATPRNIDQEHKGLHLMEQALDIYRTLGDDRGAGNAIWGIGNWYHFHLQSDVSVSSFRESLALFQKVGDETMVAWSHHMLGSALLRVRQTDEAAEHIRAAILQFEAAGDASGLTLVLDDYSALAVVRGDVPRAARLHGAARALALTTGANLSNLVDELDEANALPSARPLLAAADFERYAAEGRAMSLGDTVAYALEAEDARTGDVAAGAAGPGMEKQVDA